MLARCKWEKKTPVLPSGLKLRRSKAVASGFCKPASNTTAALALRFARFALCQVDGPRSFRGARCVAHLPLLLLQTVYAVDNHFRTLKKSLVNAATFDHFRTLKQNDFKTLSTRNAERVAKPGQSKRSLPNAGVPAQDHFRTQAGVPAQVCKI